MSIWLGKPDRNGKRSIYFAEIPYQVLLAVFLAIFVLVLPRYLGRPELVLLDSAVVMAVGFIMYLASKISLFVKGVWVSWGPGRMAAPFKVLYLLGIALIVLGALMLSFGIGRV